MQAKSRTRAFRPSEVKRTTVVRLLHNLYLHVSKQGLGVRYEYEYVYAKSRTRAFRPSKVKQTTVVRLLHNLYLHLSKQGLGVRYKYVYAKRRTRAFSPSEVKPTTLVRLLRNLCWHLYVQVEEKAGQEIAMKICMQETIRAFRKCDGAVHNRRAHFLDHFGPPSPSVGTRNDGRGTMNQRNSKDQQEITRNSKAKR